MIKLSNETINRIYDTFIPAIQGAAEQSLAAYEQGRTEDGENNFGDGSLGYMCWDNLYHRIENILPNHSFFTLEMHNNQQKIRCKNNNKDLVFSFFRVNKYSRIPNSGQSIKSFFQNQYYLSAEIEELDLSSNSNKYIIGYDIDPVLGLGDITFNMLYAHFGNKIQSKILYTFTKPIIITPKTPIIPEEIPEFIITRQALAGN